MNSCGLNHNVLVVNLLYLITANTQVDKVLWKMLKIEHESVTLNFFKQKE